MDVHLCYRDLCLLLLVLRRITVCVSQTFAACPEQPLRVYQYPIDGNPAYLYNQWSTAMLVCVYSILHRTIVVFCHSQL